jgi:ABC-type phosphate transport system permease subunit
MKIIFNIIIICLIIILLIVINNSISDFESKTNINFVSDQWFNESNKKYYFC